MRGWEEKLDEGRERVPCPDCGGSGVILVPKIESCPECGGVFEHVLGCKEMDRPR